MIADIYPLNIVRELFKKDITEEINIVGLLNEIDKLDERKAKILRWRYKDKKTLQECGEIIGLTRERIRQIQNKSFRLLRHPSRKKFYKTDSKEEILKKEEYYLELKNKYPDYVIIVKEGLYYTARNQDAKTLNNLLEYDIGSNGRHLVSGSTDSDSLINALVSNEISYIIAKNNEIVVKQEFYNGNLFNVKNKVEITDEDLNNDKYGKNKNDNLNHEEDLIRFIDELLNGRDPVTGEIYEKDHIINYEQVKDILLIGKGVIDTKIKRLANMPDRANSKWTKEEDEKLKEEYTLKLSAKDIAKMHKRTINSITRRIKKLNLDELIISKKENAAKISEKISELIQDMKSDAYNDKRLAASAVNKLSPIHTEECLKTIPYLFELLDDEANQIRQYSMKAIFFLSNYFYFDDSYTEKIIYISRNDAAHYNRKLAYKIINKANLHKDVKVKKNDTDDNFYNANKLDLKSNNKDVDIEKTLGRVCLECYNRKNNYYRKCVECFSKNLIPIIDQHCTNCLDLYDYYQKKKNYKFCYKCYSKLKQNMNFIDRFIAISYHYNYDSGLGFTLHTYKGSNMPLRKWMTFPLQSLVYIFLIKHIEKIKELYNDIDSIIPIPGHAENLLIKDIDNILPVKKILIDNRKRGRFSENTASREFNKERFSVKTKSIPNTIILFDDVYTTGSTANSAAFALKKKGVKNIILLTLARHLKNTEIELLNKDVDFDINKSIL